MPLPPAAGNPYGDVDINPMTGEKYSHVIEAEEAAKVEEPTPQPVPSRANVEA